MLRARSGSNGCMKLTEPLFATTSMSIALSASLMFGEALRSWICISDTSSALGAANGSHARVGRVVQA